MHIFNRHEFDKYEWLIIERIIHAGHSERWIASGKREYPLPLWQWKKPLNTTDIQNLPPMEGE